VPPPKSTTKLPCASCTGKRMPIADAIGSSIKNTSRAPADLPASITAFFSTSVTPTGTPTITRGRKFKSSFRLRAFSMK